MRGAIFLGGSGLSWEQRYQFLSGWLPWISDGLGMVVTLTALVWTALMWAMPSYIDVPMPALSAAAMALFATKLLKTLLLYPPKVRSGVKGAVMASVAGLSLTHTVGKAVWTGLFTSGKPFLRTPKCADPALFSQVLRVVWQETVLLALLLAAMVSMGFDRGFEDPGGQLVDGDAGGAEPALCRHLRHRHRSAPCPTRRPQRADAWRPSRCLTKAGLR